MDLFSNISMGFGVALGLMNLAYCLIGVTLGTFIGILPGVGPLVTISLLLPLTFGLPPETALIMLAGIYYGASYGGSTTAILVNLPGEASSVITCLDGHQLARQGRAGPALAIAALGSLFAGCVGTVLIAVFGPPLASVALKFGASEYFSLMLLALVLTSALVQGSMLKGIGMALIGVLFGLVGGDVSSGTRRFTFGVQGLTDGLDFVVVAMGIFAMAEIIRNLESPEQRSPEIGKINGLMPSRQDLKDSSMPIVRGTVIGSLIGILPGAGQTISTFAAYAVEKRLSKRPETFGHGAIEGVASPEAANNAAAQTAFIPTLTLGIPGTATMALMIGALMIQGIMPGPQIMTQQPQLFWGLIASMWIGNLILVVLNLPLVGLWVSMLKIPYRWLYPSIIMFACIGVYSIGSSSLDLYLVSLFGLIGYAFIKLDCEVAPFIMGFVLGPMIEEHFRRAMLIARGDPSVFLGRPLTVVFLSLTIITIVALLSPSVRRRKDQAVSE